MEAATLVPVTSLQRRVNVHHKWIGGLLRCHLPVDEGVLNARVVLDQPVLTQLEVEVLQLIEGEGVIVASVEVSDLRLLLRDLCSWSRTWIRIGGLQAELGRVHVVLLATFHGRRREGTSPPEEDA